MEIKEINISYGEKRSKNYDSEDHHLSITVLPSEEDLLERTLDDWFYFYDNKLRRVVGKMFEIEKKPEKKEVKTIAYTNTEETEKTITGPANAKLPREKKPLLEKLDPEHKYTISSKPCKFCQGLVSWEGFDRKNPTPPIHVNPDGTIKGDGRCPGT